MSNLPPLPEASNVGWCPYGAKDMHAYATLHASKTAEALSKACELLRDARNDVAEAEEFAYSMGPTKERDFPRLKAIDAFLQQNSQGG